MIKELKGLKHTNFHSTSGLATTKWGPAGWTFLFSCIMGGYPVVLDTSNEEHRLIKKHFKNLLESLSFVLPCIFCRESYKKFYKELPIQKFMSSRVELMYWLYLIKDKVNKKLIKQENECYNNEKKRLKEIYSKSKKTKQDKAIYYSNVKKFKQKTFITKQSPPFETVLEHYESFRAVCSKTAKTCALPEK